MTVEQQVLEVVKNFIAEQEITCNESVFQMDNVMENASTFIAELCDIVGYYQEGQNKED